ncbi:bifunctional aspartate kinase/homoserine dehydrogenase I [Pyxidicoccus parkwayensis]|uniref:Bifunctional aspartate kinase/homoserine dehydrogenase I n=1 Tax=Pyxidicoccus parkwayensis TaxID=2813578 RepID=A0ABX7NPC4_9BACT|nr:bifunctional aspartate kinase/homoserine dehydrogenase I [Pyxidicoccus parkwaysis]QSQ20286.1 bifunctional aspartate kinase/homoserine dehydrogenase I [Pyxidicoccus parkwaysis]
MSSAPFQVMKFGGSSVGSPRRLRQVIELISKHAKQGPLAVVVSAMGDTTDWLIEAAGLATQGDLEGAQTVVARIAHLAKTNAAALAPARSTALAARVDTLLAPLQQLLQGISLTRECSAPSRDRVLSFGELVSATLLAELLTASGTEATFRDARQLLVTDDRFGAARVDVARTRERLQTAVTGWRTSVPVIPGFIAATPDGRTTTLGRNGSDYTAALVAQGIDATEVTVWTDVLGLHTADPDIVTDAYPVAHLTHAEGLELAAVGVRMLHPRTMIPLIESGTSLRIRNTMHPDHPGTLIDAIGSRDGQRPTCIATREELALLGIEVRKLSDQFQLGERVLAALREADVTVWLSAQSSNGQSIAVVIPRPDVLRAQGALENELAQELARHEVEPLAIREPVTLLSLVAEAMGHGVNVAGRFFSALGAVGVNVRASAQGASSRSISCVVDAADTAIAVRTTHAAFNLAHQQVSLFLLGRGTVGGQLLAQLRAQQALLKDKHGIALRVVGITDSRRALFDAAGLPLEGLEERLSRVAPVDAATRTLVPLLDELRRQPVPILVDCTAASGIESLYSEAFRRGIHVVGANKKPLALPWNDREALLAEARRHHVAYHYETTVASSLPVIDTLANLVRTGDAVRLITASLSGSLGFICNELTAGVPLSVAVRTAKERGFTEPDPREDLSGTDVARKALILARELGLPLSLSDVALEPFVPAEAQAGTSVDAFLHGLKSLDADYADRVTRSRKAGTVLRYLARIDPSKVGTGSPVIRVGPVAVEAGQPAADLRGSESFVSFTTTRHSDFPLTVRGAGAGGAVTASGVLADILRISQTLRGR